MQDIHVGDLVKLSYDPRRRILFKLTDDKLLTPSEKEDDYLSKYTSTIGNYHNDLFMCVGKLNHFPISLTYASESSDDLDYVSEAWKLDTMHGINIADCYSLNNTDASILALKKFEKIRFNYTKDQLICFLEESGFAKRYPNTLNGIINFCLRPCLILMRVDTFEFYACNSLPNIQLI